MVCLCVYTVYIYIKTERERDRWAQFRSESEWCELIISMGDLLHLLFAINTGYHIRPPAVVLTY